METESKAPGARTVGGLGALFVLSLVLMLLGEERVSYSLFWSICAGVGIWEWLG